VIALLLLLPFAGVSGAVYFHGEFAAPRGGHEALLDRARQEAPHDLNAAVAKLEQRLAKEPDDADGWSLLSRSYELLGQHDKAEDAARHAAALGAKSGDAATQSESAEALVSANQGKVVPEARRLFAAALAADPTDPRARFFLGLADAQEGKSEDALGRWLALEADSPADAPWLEGLRANIERLAGSMGVSADELMKRRAALAKAKPVTGASAPPGPTRADVAAAAAMSPEDRSSMIRGMVERLADRLQREPGDVDGWLRLGRAYAVLGERQKALEAYRRATEADPKREDARTAYANARAAEGDAK